MTGEYRTEKLRMEQGETTDEFAMRLIRRIVNTQIAGPWDLFEASLTSCGTSRGGDRPDHELIRLPNGRMWFADMEHPEQPQGKHDTDHGAGD